MTNDFYTIYSSAELSLSQAWRQIDSVLRRNGFRPASSISRFGHDELSKEFELLDQDDVEDEYEVGSVREKENLTLALQKWSGLLVKYSRSDFGMYVGIASVSTVGTNYFIQLSDSVLIRCFHEDSIEDLYVLFIEIAGAVSASSAVSDAGLGFLSLNTSSVVSLLTSNPSNSGYPCSLGILSKNLFTYEQVIGITGNKFVVNEFANYWLVEEKDYLEIFPTLLV